MAIVLMCCDARQHKENDCLSGHYLVTQCLCWCVVLNKMFKLKVAGNFCLESMIVRVISS